jgi:SpoVK/Ycf46/Vps4 family AAA+-type ATPase
LNLYFEILKLKSLGFLDKTALEAGCIEQKSNAEFDGGPILDDIKNVMFQFTNPPGFLRKPSYGLLLYGPPGTGKTLLCTVIIKKMGLVGLVPPMSSAELNRSKVGETEQLLIAIFHRALYMPYLLCCIAIDEIDALTPKRTDKSAEHKIDTLSLLLSLIGGIKEVPNVFVIASTNRLNSIDDAFARRLQDKFYVGRLNADERMKLIMKIFDDKANLPAKFKEDARNYFEKNSSYVKLLTSNFSAAALSSLRSQILFFFDQKNSNIVNNELVKLCDKVANDFKIKLGGYSIPSLLENSLMSRKQTIFESFMEATQIVDKLSNSD